MPWLQLELEATPDSAEQLSELLQAAGAGAVTLQDAADQPLFEPPPGTTPLWNSTRVVGLFEADSDIPEVLTYLQQQLEPEPLPRWHLNPLEDRDWVRAWMDNFQPMRFGEQLWICPTGYTPPQPQAINILLDPGLAFGTGTHPTTAMCLRWLDAHPPHDLAVIDYGCGSGILGLAALLLGADHVIGVDTDPQALEASRENARRNGVEDSKLDLFLPDNEPETKADIMLANILAQPLIGLAPHLASRTRPGGDLVLSGILSNQAREVMAAYEPWFVMDEPEQREEWIRLTGRRHDR